MRTIDPAGISIITVVVVLPLGTAVSGALTWSMFGNVYGGLAFLGLFIVGVAVENVRQRCSVARRVQTDAEVGRYIARLHAAARESGVELGAPRRAQKVRPRYRGLTCRVADGTRTRDSQDHNLVLYQLNYSHHRCGPSGGGSSVVDTSCCRPLQPNPIRPGRRPRRRLRQSRW